MTVSRATLASWMIRLGELIVPLMNLMEEVQLGDDLPRMDETTVQVLKENGRAATTKSRMWVRRGGPPGQPVILFNYEPTRAGAVAWRLTEDFKGYLRSDGDSGYTAVGQREGIVHVGRLAHAWPASSTRPCCPGPPRRQRRGASPPDPASVKPETAEATGLFVERLP